MGVVAVNKFLGPIEKSTNDDYDASSWLSFFFLLFLFFSSSCLSNPGSLWSAFDTSIVLLWLKALAYNKRDRSRRAISLALCFCFLKKGKEQKRSREILLEQINLWKLLCFYHHHQLNIVLCLQLSDHPLFCFDAARQTLFFYRPPLVRCPKEYSQINPLNQDEAQFYCSI